MTTGCRSTLDEIARCVQCTAYGRLFISEDMLLCEADGDSNKQADGYSNGQAGCCCVKSHRDCTTVGYTCHY